MEIATQKSSSLIKKIVFIGPESTGKSTLARLLAQRFRTVWVPEYLRDYCQQNWDKKKVICTWDDLTPIVTGQLQREKHYLTQSNRLLFLDTNVLTLYIYSLVYYHRVPESIEKACFNLTADDYYFLTDIDVPWEPDVLRDRPHQRADILKFMKDILIQKKFPFTLVSGSVHERVTLIEHILTTKVLL